MKRFLALTLMVLFIAWPFYIQAKTIGVDLDGACSCCSEASVCYTSIQEAIRDAQDGDVVMVCEGEYDENIDLIGKNITLRSLDPNDPGIVDATIIDGGFREPVVSFIEGESPNALLSGLTLRNGRGGIFCRSSSPTITQCKITGNMRGPYGGGIYCQSASPSISHCTISNNTADDYGGGIYCTSSSPHISYCAISANKGGGIACKEGSEPEIIHCTIKGNEANPDGSYGYGIFCNNASPVITDCTIKENCDDGINCENNAPFLTTVTDCFITGNNSNGISFSGNSPPKISDCSIHYNKGIGISCNSDPNSESSTTIETCTINWNESDGIYCINASLSINDCTIQENSKDGINCENSSITINHCTITGNNNEGVQCMSSTSFSVLDCIIGKNKGTGIHVQSSTPMINGCTIHENEKGGIFSQSSAPKIINCQIIANSSDNGGGIYYINSISQDSSSSVIRDCTISKNSVNGSGGGIYLFNTSLRIDNCNIKKNKARDGGGIYTYRSNNNDYRIDITRCSLIGNLASYNGGGIFSNLFPINPTNNPYPTNATNCLISQNGARDGGGIYCYSPTNITNCTIVENLGESYGGIYCTRWNPSQIKNCIIWNNQGKEIYGGTSIITFSDIRGGVNGEGNIDSDPLFMESETGNYYLKSGSPCIDNGYPNCLCEEDPNCIEKGDPNDALTFDKEGISRPQGCGVDIGAYEYVDPNSSTPRASFKVNILAGFMPLEVEFDASSSGGSLFENPNDPNYPVFLWDFGDGNTSKGEKVVHTYTSYGFFDVSLTVTTECNSHTLTLDNFIKVTSPEPTRHVGKGHEHASIQEAINDAEEGEYILVHDGIYFERINFKGKWIRIQSENGAGKTIIDGGVNGRVVTFNTLEDAYSVLEGFTLQNGSATDGGGIYCYYSSPTISRCIIRKNSADNYGGGIYCHRSSPLIMNCVIVENRGGYNGGISCRYSSPSIINNTIVKNIGRTGNSGGISCYSYSAPIIKNCIIWDNLPNEIYMSGSGNTPIITYSDIRGGHSGEGNINKDPLFLGSETGNYYLDPNSSCIDSGDSANAPSFDKEGIQRNQDAGIDMGAYEYVDTSSCTPRASFIANETAGHYPLTVSFDASSSGGSEQPGVEYFWKFGDGNTVIAYDTIIEHTYNNPNDFNDPNDPYGSYNVSLRITTNCGSHTLILNDLIKIKSIFPTKEVGKEGDYLYSSIQEAIDDARNGEYILVHDRIYNENLDFKEKRITIRSENGPFATYIDGSTKGSTVTFKSGEDRYSVLEGFTIQDGSFNYGGGIHCWGSSPHIVKCRLLENTANNFGGGIYCYASSAIIEQCIVSENTSNSGGGVYCEYSSPLIDHCDILENESAGIFLRYSSGTIRSSTINENIYGGIECYSSSPEIINCIIAKNIDDKSGGIYCNSSSPSILNCTIADNEIGYYGAGGIYCQSSSPVITNSILWSPNSLKEIEKDYHSNPKVTFSDVRGCYPGEGNICDDPSFVADWAGFYYLSFNSPCIETGDPNNEGPIIDIDDIQRPLDADLDGLAIHEMGAYEWVRRSQCIPRPCFEADKVSNDQWTYTFDALCSGGSLCEDLNYFLWDFGDGNSAQGTTVNYTYGEPGFYDVTLTVTINGEFRSTTILDYIKIVGPIKLIQVCKGEACDFESIQDAIEWAEDGTSILVHDGIYKENINFRGKRITLYSVNGPDTTFIDGGGTGTVVTFNNSEDMYSILDGFTIQNGNANEGGGIYCYFSSPSISNCIIRDNINHNGNGGGVYCYCSSPGLTNCSITGNIARHGGGIYLQYSSSLNIFNCEITKNMTKDYGGGIYLNSCLKPNIIHCTIADNKSGNHGGGLYSTGSSPLITDSIIWNNSPNGIYGDTDPDKVTYNDIQQIPEEFEDPDLHNIYTDPYFVAPEIGNYYLRPHSHCIDSGTYILSFDKEEIPRPQGEDEAVDMGAFEFVNRGSCLPRPSFEAIPPKGESPLTVNFDATSSGGSLYEDPNDPNYPIFLWDFGDGTIIQGAYDESIEVEHTYTDPYGIYDVSLTVMTKCGSRTLKIRDCVKVRAKNPTREVGEGYDYSSIQKAIDNAENGEYILVHNGTYSENINFKGKGITLRSAYGPEATIINGGAYKTTVEFTNAEDDTSVLEGFTVQNNSSRNYYKIYCFLSSPKIKGCIIKGESTCCTETGYDYGSGIYCDYCSSPQVINCLIIGNRNNTGGGISCRYNSSPELTNCTISNNYADYRGGAIYAENYSSPIITNSILWGNLCANNPLYNEIFYTNNSSIRINFSDIQDIPDEYTDPYLHNIDSDPYFVNPCECNYRIPFDSPCFDACDCKAKDDIEGKPRPTYDVCDMGAYEYGTPPLTNICLESQQEGSCVEFGIFKESKEPCSLSPSPGLSFIDIDPNGPGKTPYCKYVKALQYTIPYHWIMKLDFEAYTDSNSSFVLQWEPHKLQEQDQWIWKLVRGVDADGEVLVYDMILIDNYQIRKNDDEYLSIIFEELPCHEFDLKSGWNLVSVPIITDDMSRNALFPDAIAVYYYDAANQIYIYVEEYEFMKPGIGYWVLVKEPDKQKICSDDLNDLLTGYATLDSPDGLHLEKGWNMIGSLYGYTALNLSEGYIKAVYEYTNDGIDNEYSEPIEFDTNSGAYLVSGKGYWILLSEECYLNGNAVQELPAKERLRMLYSPRFREVASSDNWSGEITAFGQKSQDCATKARIIIGISDKPLQIPSPPNPPCTTIELNLINPPSDHTKYTKDIRSAGQDSLNWVLWVKDGESSDHNYPLLQWEIPSGLDNILELRKGQSETGDILVEDMRTTTSYQVKQEDEELLTVVWRSKKYCYRDADNDTYGDAFDSIQAAVCPEGYVRDNTDCDDDNPAVHPGAQEVCNGLNDDCDGEVDEDMMRDCSNVCGEMGTETCENGQWVNCSAPPIPEEVCDNEDNDCDGKVDEGLNRDCSNACGEGTETCVEGEWVNCTAPEPHEEICDGEDNDCDGVIPPEETIDTDKDGFVACNDCDDNDPSVYPRLVSIVSAEGYPGETDVAVPITIDDAVGFAGGDIILTYDLNILTARKVIIAPLIQDFLTDSYIIEAEGKVVLGIANSESIESGSGSLAEIIFDVSEEAVIGTQVPLMFQKVILNDADSEQYCSLGINGEFRVVERCHKGDLNQDGEITSADAILTLKISVGLIDPPSDYQVCAGDVNNDDEINAADAILILRAAVLKETIFYMAPDYGLPGATVEIIGRNFGETQGDSVLYYGDTPAKPTSWMDYEIVTTVPSDIQEGTVDVYLINTYGYPSNSCEFSVGASNQRLKSLNFRDRATEDPKTVLIPSRIIAAPCNQVNIPVETDDAEGIAGMDIELVFDPDVLTPLKVERTALTDGFLLMFKDSGDGRLRVSLANDAGIIEDSGALINVIFEVASAAQKLDSTGISICYIKLYDEGANLLEETVSEDGQVLIEEEGLCEPEQTSGTPINPPGIGSPPYYPYYYSYAGYYYSPGDFSLQANWMTIFGTYTSGNGYNYLSGNPYNYPLGTGYDYLFGNGYHYPAGNGYNYPGRSSYNYLSGNGYDYTYQGRQQFLNPAFYLMQNSYEYNHLPSWDYQTVYPDVSRFILW